MASTSFKGIIYFRITKKLFTSIQSPGIGCGINRVKFSHLYTIDRKYLLVILKTSYKVFGLKKKSHCVSIDRYR